MANSRKNLHCTMLAAALAASVSAFPVSAAVIDFESVATPFSCNVQTGGSIDGFTLSPFDNVTGGGFNNVPACNIVLTSAHSGTQFMLQFNSLFGEFTKDAGTFTLNSLFVHADNRAGQSTVRFQGLDGIGGAVLHTRDVVIEPAWQKVDFAGWTNVKTFTWDSLVPGVSNIAIDDFEFNAAVPEPNVVLLLALGLSGLAGLGRVKRQ